MSSSDLIAHAKGVSFSGAGGRCALEQGGTEADLSGSGPGYLKQASMGAVITVGAIAAGDLPTAIDAAKIADGSISNTEFQRLNGVTGNIQSQIDAIIAGTGGVIDVTCSSPLVSSGGATPNIDFASQAANLFFAGPATGSADPSFRAIIVGDLPLIPASQINSGHVALARGGTAADLSATGAGFLLQATAGAAVTVRALDAADIATGIISASRLGSGTANNTTVLYGDGAYRTPVNGPPTIYTASDGATVTFDLNNSTSQIVTLGGNRTLAVANDTGNVSFDLKLKQDGTGGRTVVWFGTIIWPDGVEPTLSTDPNVIDWFGFQRASSGVYYGVVIGSNMS